MAVCMVYGHMLCIVCWFENTIYQLFIHRWLIGALKYKLWLTHRVLTVVYFTICACVGVCD